MKCLWCGDDLPDGPGHLCKTCETVDGAIALLAELYYSEGDERYEPGTAS